MPIYAGRRPGTFRVVVWKHNRPHEQLVEGGRADAREHEARMRVELGARGAVQRRASPTFETFSTLEYEPHARAHLGASTWRLSRRYVVANLTGHFGPTRLDALSVPMIDVFVRTRQEAGLKPSVINHELQVLRTMLRFAEEIGYAVPDIKIRYMRSPDRRVQAWSSGDVARLCAAAAGLDPAMLPLILFLLNTGMRKGESIAAPWSWIDWKRSAIRLDAYEDWAPKNKSPREIPLSDSLRTTLEALPRESPWIFPIHGARRAVFPNERFRAIVRAAKLRGGPHTCRHTFASMYLAADGSLFELSKLLGHSTTRTTELYAHLMPEHLENARNVVNVGVAGTNHGATVAKKRSA